ncbi:MAG: NAD(P)-binding domain-containing protein [Bryobacteraceae bacterium]
MTESLVTYAIYAVILIIPLAIYLHRQQRAKVAAAEAAEKGKVFSETPRAQHPQIDVSNCIGCQSCTSVCPEGLVLGMVGGKAAVVNPVRCIGHGLCADACPVGAITMAIATPGMRADLPYLTPEYETSVPGLFIAGELGGLALIRNAINQGRDCVDSIAKRVSESHPAPSPDIFDVLIVGAGPGGISAALRSIEHKLRYVVLERDTVGGTVSKYPRQKLVMTAPVEFPLYGMLKKREFSKESLIAFWEEVTARPDFHIYTNESVENVVKDADGCFTVTTQKVAYRARNVVMAMGRAGSPRKLGVKGEELPKVMYRLIEADHYRNKNILVVGGGDSAVEAALGLARQKGNRVTISYRKDWFGRIKERNSKLAEEAMNAGYLNVIFNSIPTEFKDGSVVLEVDGAHRELPNDYVWIFAGGVAPNEFLKRVGVSFGSKDLTLEAGAEARSAAELANAAV